ncbi:efflux RND transporter permease subunit, partial [Acinetobacter baumannii]
PFFTFMGLLLERSGMAEDLLDTVGRLFGTLRGGLAVAVVLPLSALWTFLLMHGFGLSANLMSLGGLAIAIGLLVDA